MSNSPEQIRLEIERTRSELSDNVNALGDKVNPGSIARRQVGRVRGAATSVKDAVMGSAADATDTGRQVATTMGDAVSDAPSAVARKAQGSPIAAGLIAFGAGLLVSSLLPASKVEQQAADKVKDTAQPLVEDLTDTAKEVAGNLKEPTQQAFEEVKSTATDAAATVQEETTSAVDDVKYQTQDAKDSVQNAAQ
jgi:polyhydroxyalkanoate synthesis regulator phasin